MLRIRVTKSEQTQEFEHGSGPVEFGRGSPRGCRRIPDADTDISCDHLRVEELAGGRVRVENLSHTNVVKFSWGEFLPTGGCQELNLPLGLVVQHIRIELDTAVKVEVEPAALKTIALPAYLQESGKSG